MRASLALLALLALLACALSVAQPSSVALDAPSRELATLSEALSMSPADDLAIAQARRSGRTVTLPDTYNVGQQRVDELVSLGREYRAIRSRVSSGAATPADLETLAYIKQQLHTMWANASPEARDWAAPYLRIALNRVDALAAQIRNNVSNAEDMMRGDEMSMRETMPMPAYTSPVMQPRTQLRYGRSLVTPVQQPISGVMPSRVGMGVIQTPISSIYPARVQQPIRVMSLESLDSDLSPESDLALLSVSADRELDAELESPLESQSELSLANFETNAPAGPWGFGRFGFGPWGFRRFGFGFPFGGFGFPFGGFGFPFGFGFGFPGLWW